MKIKKLDHLVLAVADVEKTIRFYVDVLGMTEVDLATVEKLSHLGNIKSICIEKGQKFTPMLSPPRQAQRTYVSSPIRRSSTMNEN